MATGKSTERLAAAIAIALHVSVGAALLGYEPARSALLATAPLSVDLIAPPKLATQPEPRPEMPQPAAKLQPRPLPHPPRPPAPAIAIPPEAPAAIQAPPPAAAPAPAALAPAAPVEAPFTPPSSNAASLDNPQPDYPALSKRLGEQGRVRLRVHVSPGGAAEEVVVEASSGHPRLDEAARASVLRWKFLPATRGGLPVAAWGSVAVIYRLEDR